MRRPRTLVLLSSAFALSMSVAATRATEPSHAPGAQTTAVEQRDELLPDEQIQQVLSRLTFGARPGDVALVRSMGVDAWIDWQLHPERIDDHAADALMSRYAILNMKTVDIVGDINAVRKARRAPGASAPELARAAQTTRTARQAVGGMQSARLARAVATNRQLDEVMVDFWENHFSVFAGKGQTSLFLAQYDRDVIRPNALGSFRGLLGAVAKSPAMLFFLDNWQSAADSVHPTLARRPKRQAKRGLNENYARELMELHTLGVDGGYTQKDVQEVARALTGWTFNRRTGAFTFNPAMHDAGAKTILGKQFPAGHGEEEGEQVLDLIARQPATAHFITTKLARYFVSDDPPTALVDRCATVFSTSNGDIRTTVRCIITSPEFFSRAAYRAKVKTPFQLVTSALRAMDAQPDTTPRTARLVAQLGQPIFGRQTPDGWPDRGDAWMNTGAILNRINFGSSLAAGRVRGARLNDWPPFDSLRALPRAQQVDGVIRTVLGGQVSAETRQILMSGDNPMASKLRRGAANDINGMVAAADEDHEGRPNGLAAAAGLSQIVGLALGAPEFQRR